MVDGKMTNNNTKRVAVIDRATRDFFFGVCYAFLMLAQRVDTREPRREYAWNTSFKQSVLNDVLNIRFKRFKFFLEQELNILLIIINIHIK